MQEALFYTKLENQTLRCDLCPWNCILKPGQTGVCKVRTNENGLLYTQVYNKIAAFGIDPIEKKPLYHFHPGSNILSVGEVGCNLQCTFCQNHRISQCYAEDFTGFKEISSKQIVKEALKTYHNIGIAYTYNEPFTFYEFMLDTARLAQKEGLKNVVVSNGYIHAKPLQNLLPFIDAFNIDLKAFTSEFYQKQTKGQLEPVLNTLKLIAKSNALLEITNLVIPGLNDDEKRFSEMVLWITHELGDEVPLHLSRYFPQYKMDYPSTPTGKLERLYDLAKEHLQHVYLGNVSDSKRSSTYCHNCSHVLIERNHYHIKTPGMDDTGCCKKCKAQANVIL